MTDSYSGGGGEGGVTHGSDCNMAKYPAMTPFLVDKWIGRPWLFRLQKGQTSCRDSSWVVRSRFRRRRDLRWLVNQFTLPYVNSLSVKGPLLSDLTVLRRASR
jgi:hypothetical protein